MMLKVPKRMWHTLVAIAACLVLPVQGMAQSFPNKAITILVGTPPGGPIDTTARLIGEYLGRDFGQTVIVDNRPGASATIAAAALAKAAPDGHTLLLTSRGITMAPALYPKLPFDTARAFAPVAIVSAQPTLLMVSPEFPARTLAEFMKLVKAHPGKFTYASTGNGSLPHLAGALFQSQVGVEIVHVPYKGAAPLMTDLTASRVDFTFASPGLGGVKNGRVAAIANASGKRSHLFSDIPAISEAGMDDFNFDTWYGLLAPAGTPKDVVTAIDNRIRAMLALPEVQARLSALGAIAGNSTPDSFAASFQVDLVRYGAMVRRLNIRAD